MYESRDANPFYQSADLDFDAARAEWERQGEPAGEPSVPPMTLTLIQFRDAYRDEYLRHAGGWCSKTKYNRLYPPESRYDDWYLTIVTAVKAGAVVRRQVCDDLYRRAPNAWRHLVHDFGTGWLPEWYLNPDARKANAR